MQSLKDEGGDKITKIDLFCEGIVESIPNVIDKKYKTIGENDI